MMFYKRDKNRLRELEVKFVVINRQKEAVAGFRNRIGADSAAEAFNTRYVWNSYKVIEVEEY